MTNNEKSNDEYIVTDYGKYKVLGYDECGIRCTSMNDFVQLIDDFFRKIKERTDNEKR